MASATPILGDIASVADAVAAISKEIFAWEQLHNTPGMLAAAVAEILQKQKEADIAAVASGDVAAVEKGVAQ